MTSIQQKWTPKETTFLKNNYTKMTDDEIALALNRTPGSIERKRMRLGLKKKVQKLGFTPKQIDEILHSNLTYNEIATKYSITPEQARYIFKKNKASQLYVGSVKKWTTEEDVFLQKNYVTMGDGKIGDALNRSATSVLKRRVKLGLKRECHIVDNKPDRYWTEEEVEYLVTNIDALTYSELSEKLNRSIRGIAVKASRLGLITEGSKWSEKEDDILLQYKNRTKEELSFLLNRSPKAVKHRANKIGINLGDKEHKTDLERKIERMLKELNLPYREQMVLGSDFNFRADFVINDKIVIEAHGDYWHGNPILYPNPNEMQELAICKDQLKKKYFESLGYSVYEIWEMDVRDNYTQVKDYIARLVGNF